MRLDIAFSINDKFVDQLCVVIKSILLNDKTNNDFFFHVLYSDLKEENINLLCRTFNNKNVHFYYYLVDKKYFYDIPIVAEHLENETFFRLLLPKVIDNQIEKILYLDSDIIVKSELTDLYNINLENNYIAACKNITDDTYKVVGLKSRDQYFNAGILLINLKKWREDDIFLGLIKYAHENKEKIIFADQDILNGFFSGNWLNLHPKWNVQDNIYAHPNICLEQYSEKEYREAYNNPCILHFSGKYKPWNIFSYQEKFEEYFEVSKLLGKRGVPKLKYRWDIEYKVFVWGAGQAGIRAVKYLDYFDLDIEGLIDSKKYGSSVLSKNVFSPLEVFQKYEKIKILIASMYHEEIKHEINKLNENFKKDVEFFIVEPQIPIFEKI